MENSNTHILLIDGVCNLCNRMALFIIKRDKQGKFKFAFIQSKQGQTLLQQFGFPTNYMDSFVYIIGDKYFLKSSAVLNVLKEFGGIWKLMYIFMVFPRPFRDFLYHVIAKSRYKIFGKRNTCAIPTSALTSRFYNDKTVG